MAPSVSYWWAVMPFDFRHCFAQLRIYVSAYFFVHACLCFCLYSYSVAYRASDRVCTRIACKPTNTSPT